MNGSEISNEGDIIGSKHSPTTYHDLFHQLVRDDPSTMSWIYSSREGRYVFCSESASAFYGRTHEEMCSLGIHDVLTGNAAQRVRQELQLAAAAAESEEHRVKNRHFRFDEYRDNGSYFLTEAMVVFGPIGDSFLVVGMTRDMTAHRKKVRVVQESQAFLKFIAENAGDILWTYDFETDRYTYVSPSIITLRGFSPEEALQQRLLDALTPESAEKARKLVSQRIEALKKGDMSAKFGIDEFEQVRKDGSIILTEVMTTFVTDERGQVVGIVGVARDIRERKEREARQKEIEKKLYEAQKNESIGRIAGGVAHELSNALTPVVGYADLLEKALSRNENLLGYVNHISVAARRATLLIDQLLDFTRSQFLDLRSIDLNHAVLGIRRLLRSSIRENIEIVIKHDGSSPRVKIDLQKFRQIIVNLALNAQDAMPDGGKFSVEISRVDLDGASAQSIGMAEGAYARLVVADTGTGIPPEILPNIFDPFFTTKKDALSSGLGLSSVYGIVKQHGGHIRVDSIVGSGTTLSIMLPLYIQDEELVDNHGRGDESGIGSRKTILIVEDEEMVRSLFADLLGSQGYRLIMAENADDCIRKANAHDGPIDLLITDIIMPGMNGSRLAAEIRAIYPSISVLFMSGYDQRIITESIRLPEKHHFIRKPFSLTEISSFVERLLLEQKR